MSKWGNLLPANVSDLMNFNRDDVNWQYEEHNRESMPSKQAEGVAYLWNLLNENNLAILADEVGMGKTFQALGIASLLWRMKPSAKILVMAPNWDICSHWKREYKTFLQHHYRKMDHSVRNVADGEAVHEPILCRNLKELQNKVAEGWGHFYLTTIHSLSGLVADKTTGDFGRAARKAGREIRKDLFVYLGEQGFDLLIIDEAHYFRNVKGGSQRVQAAQTFFGGETSPLAQKVLLMTATPSHSGLQDVVSIISYFKDLDPNIVHSPSAMLEKYALRRLRLMEGQHGDFHSKYHYRREEDLSVDFSDNPSSELFFALYQKKLAEQLRGAKAGRRFLYGYLEGFESVGIQDAAEESSDEKDESNTQKESFRKAPDTELLESLTKSYAQVMGKFPEHPKYSALVKRFVPERIFEKEVDLHELKHLVFVRRIPSVREMTQRVNAGYDSVLMAYLLSAWDLTMDNPSVKQWQKRGYRRRDFEELLFGASSNKMLDVDGELTLTSEDEEEQEHEDDESKLGSKVADLFVVKKLSAKARETDVERTDCSNVRLRFRKPDSLFALFLEPARDYRSLSYEGYYKNDGAKVNRDLYTPAAKDARLSQNFPDVLMSLEKSPDAQNQLTSFDRPLPTIWGLMYGGLDDIHRDIIEKWLDRDPGILENFSNYLQAGILFSSPVIVELYVWFTTFNRQNREKNVQKKYADFVESIQPKVRTSLYLSYFKEALESFESLCEKIVDHELTDWQRDWTAITRLQNPAWYASGESSNRQRLIMGFNTPFYPNVLIATSVFQEGVNLHLQCRNVYHYGIAWTPGDNEQRVGRVDRLFGRVNTQLAKGEDGELRISYPYLAGSFDEDQVGAFIYNKSKVEEEMDRCLHREFSREIQTDADRIDWKQFLRKPLSDKAYDDPYPAKFDSNPKEPLYKACEIHDDEEVLDHLRDVLLHTLEQDELYNVVDIEDELKDGLLYLLDPKLADSDNERHQPIVVERNFSSKFSALIDGTVYYVTLKTPIASKVNLSAHAIRWDRIEEMYQKRKGEFPLIQLALDQETKHSNFYLYMKVNLPVFIGKGRLHNFSSEEVLAAYVQLRDFSDWLEKVLFSSEQDLKKTDLKVASRLKSLETISKKPTETTNRVNSVRLRDEWSLIESYTGDVASLSEPINVSKHSVFHDKANKEKIFQYSLTLNHQFPFISLDYKKNKLNVLLNYPAVDTQEEEMILLERWHKYAIEFGLNDEGVG